MLLSLKKKLWISLKMISLMGYFSHSSFAHPVTFTDGVAVSLISQPGVNLWQANYSLSSSIALGFDYVRLGAEDPSRLGLARVNYLVKRWLGQRSQGNLYLLGGIGGGAWSSALSRDQSPYRWVGMLGLQTDYETRKFYTALMARAFSDASLPASDSPFHIMYRAGLAPYQGRANELQMWLVGQLSYHQAMSGHPSLTLLMRLFIQTTLCEVGADLEGRPWIHLMAHF